MNIVLIPALFLLLGLVVYKKVIEPRKAGGSQGAKSRPAKAKGKAKGRAKVTKVDATPVPAPAKVNSKVDKKAVKARAAAGTGRMGSVL